METRQSLKTTTLSGAWRDRIEAVNPGRGQKGTRTSRRGLGHHVAKVWPLVVFCWREGIGPHDVNDRVVQRFKSEEHTSELQSLMRISYAVFCLKKKTKDT